MKTKFILLIIVVCAALLRFWQIGVNPPSLTWDEVAWGYNAYSLSIDGRDEFGKFLPYTYLESFGDFKPPMYAYLTVIPVLFFGLTEFATRFPSALLGVVTVLITYLLVKRIFYTSEQREIYGLVTVAILAISPWHIMLSRAAFEANVATFFIVCGVWMFLKGIQDNKWYLTLAAMSFVLSLYTFNSARIVVPILVTILGFAFWRVLLKHKVQSGAAGIVGALFLLPIVPFLLSPQASLRFKEVNIFSDISIIERVNQQIENDHNALWSRVLHNRRLAYGVEYLKHYFDNLSPMFLFIKGDGNPKFSTQDIGQLYIWEIPFILSGIFLLFRRKEGYWWIIPLWLLIGIIPAGTARETPHALRIEAVLPTFQILTAYGLVALLSVQHKYRRVVLGITSFVILVSVLKFQHGYYRHYPYEYSREWQYVYKDVFSFTRQIEGKYDEIRMTTELGRPYIYYLFYAQVPPDEFRATANIRRDAFGFVTVESVGKYRFTDRVNQPSRNKEILYIDTVEQLPDRAVTVAEFRLLNGSSRLAAYTM